MKPLPQIRTESLLSNPNTRFHRYVMVDGLCKGMITIPQRTDEPWKLQLTEGNTSTVYTYDSLVDLAEALRDKFQPPFDADQQTLPF